MSEDLGRRGPKGDTGERGARGERGMPRVQARAVAYLFALNTVLIVIALLFVAHYVHSTQAAQQRQGEQIEQKLCTTLGKLAILKPPPGSPLTNPSRAYDQELHAALAQLSPDLGCR